MTPLDVINAARVAIQDTRVGFYRYSDTDMLTFVNQTLTRMAVLRPDLFSVIEEWALVPETVLQSCPADSQRLVEIFNVVGENAVQEVSRDVFDQNYPSWIKDGPGTPVNFMRHIRNPNKFFVYPRPSTCCKVLGEYVQIPPAYALEEEIQVLPASYFAALVDGTVYVAESIDNEHVNSGRAKLAQEMFLQQLQVGLQTRLVTDTESGGLKAGDDPKRPEVM
jgi:hypothetical protein